MAILKVTIGWLKGVYGPSESWITPDLSLTALPALITGLLARRTKLVESSVSISRVRIADLQSKRRSVAYPPGSYDLFDNGEIVTIPPKGKLVQTNKENIADQARSCLQVRVTWDTDRRTLIYLPFPPDSVISGGEGLYTPAENPAWDTELRAFFKFIKDSGFQIYAQDRSVTLGPFPITNWVAAAGDPAPIGVAIKNTIATGFAERDVIRITGVRRKGTDRVSYNGKYYIDTVNTTQVSGYNVYFLRGSEGGDASSVKLPGYATKQQKKFYPVAKLEAIQGGTHKRGKPLGTPSGRRQKRVSLDF